MSDFETRLAESLRAGAAGAPEVAGLAAAARGRARRRRTSNLAGLGAVVLAVVAIPVGIATLGDGNGRPAPVLPADSSSPSASSPVPRGWRVESWRDVELRVPGDWGYGSRVAWCAFGARDVPLVERPGGVTPAIGCGNPQQGYGVSFGASAAVDPAQESGEVWQYGWESPDQVKAYPEDAWLSTVVLDDVAVSVATPERRTTQTIVDSIRLIHEVDGNGCTPFDQATVPTTDAGVSVCRYDAEGWLEQSERLSSQESRAALDALKTAPTREDQGGCWSDPEPSASVDLVSQGTRVRVVWNHPDCPAGNGVYFNGRAAELTEEVMYWASRRVGRGR